MKSFTLIFKMALVMPFFTGMHAYSQFNEWDWYVQNISEETLYSTDIAIDDLNNVYFSGYHYGPVQVGDSAFDVQEGMSGSFVAVYDKNGNFRWAVSLKKEEQGPFGMVDDCHLAIDSRQNLYVAGEFDFSVDFGDTILHSYGNWDVFLAKYDSSGQFQWAYHIGGATDDQYEDIKIDLHDNIYLSMNHSRPGFDNTVHYGNNDTSFHFLNYCAGVVSLHTDASFSWINYGTGEYYEVRAENLILYEERFLFAQFRLFGEFHFNGQSIEADLEPVTHLVVHIDENGHAFDILKFPHYWITDMLMDSQSNFYTCGFFNQPIIILGDTLVPATLYEYLLVKYDYEMEPLWYVTYPNSTNILDIKMALDWDNGIHLCSPFDEDFILADTLLHPESDQALFIAKFNPSGHVTGVELIPTSGFIYCSSLKSDHCRNLFLGGGYNTDISFGTDTLSITPGSDAVFLAKFTLESDFLDLGNDTIILISDTLRITVDTQAEYIEWSDGSTGADLEFRAADFGEGSHDIWVFVKNNFGCYDSDTLTIHVIDNSSLNDHPSPIAEMYPNPARDILHILLEQQERMHPDLSLEIYAPGGISVLRTFTAHQSGVKKNEFYVDVSFLQNGMYFLIIKDEMRIIGMEKLLIIR